MTDFDPNITRGAVIQYYDSVVREVEEEGQSSERAYGGVVRMAKGKMLETIARHMTAVAWRELGGDFARLSLRHSKLKIPIRREYVEGLPPEIAEHIRTNIEEYAYRCGVDLHVCIDENLVLGIECKAYAENAMMKRILVDFQFMKSMLPDMHCMLIQLESRLTGDYSAPRNPVVYGSRSTHTLMSYFPSVDLNFVTLLESEQKVQKPIHKHYKPLHPELLDKGIEAIRALLAKAMTPA